MNNHGRNKPTQRPDRFGSEVIGVRCQAACQAGYIGMEGFDGSWVQIDNLGRGFDRKVGFQARYVCIQFRLPLLDVLDGDHALHSHVDNPINLGFLLRNLCLDPVPIFRNARGKPAALFKIGVDVEAQRGWISKLLAKPIQNCLFDRWQGIFPFVIAGAGIVRTNATNARLALRLPI